MKKILFALLAAFMVSCAFPQDYKIKSLKAYAGSESQLPVITLDDYLTIEFDVQSEFTPNLNVVFRYCNRDWKPYDNLFLQNNGQNVAYNIDFVRLPNTVQDAEYHVRESFPDANGYISFPFSGKWRFYITDSNDTSKVFADGRFIVINDVIDPSVKIKNGTLEDKVYYPLEIGRVFEISTSLSIPKELYPANVLQAEVVENHKLDEPYIIDKSFNTNTRQFYWNGDRDFTFTARDVKPGNEYRQVDLRNNNVYIGPDVRAHIEGIEQSRFYKPGLRDLNGGSILINFKNPYATYLNVKFEIRPPEEIRGDIYIVGAFNNWQLLPEYRMDNSGGLYSKTVRLKRGVYDYQYVVADIINNRITHEDWLVLEGNFWETRNDYYIFVYYNEPNYGGYDRIIAYKKISGR